MASIVRMPGVSADSEEATLIEWSVKTGDQIRSGESLAVVETEKANVDIEADGDGILWRTLAEPGESVTVGNPIAVLLGSGEDASAGESLLASLGFGEAAPAAEQAAPSPAPQASEPTPVSAPAPAAADSGASPEVEWTRVFSSPLARRLAQQSGVAIESIAGTGPGGRIVRADVERAVEAPGASQPVDVAPAPVSKPVQSGGYTDTPHSGLRRAVANALTSSKRDAPHFYLTTTCRVDALMALRAEIIAQSAQKVSINDLFIKAVGKALRAVPEMNVIWTPDAVRQFDAVDVSVAIASDKGLVTPVLRDVDTLSVTQISSQVRDFVDRANAGRLKQHELEGGAFTISNLGMFGVEQFGAIINPPQVAILAVGAAVTVPIVVDGEIVVGNTVTVTVSVDHRPVDGVIAARWLASLRGFVEHPLTMLV